MGNYCSHWYLMDHPFRSHSFQDAGHRASVLVRCQHHRAAAVVVAGTLDAAASGAVVGAALLAQRLVHLAR